MSLNKVIQTSSLNKNKKQDNFDLGVDLSIENSIGLLPLAVPKLNNSSPRAFLFS